MFCFESLHCKCHKDGCEYSCNRVSMKLSTLWSLPDFKYPVKVSLKVPSIAIDFFFYCIHEWLSGPSDYHERNVFSLDKNTFFKADQKTKTTSPVFGRNVPASMRASADFTAVAFLTIPLPPARTSFTRTDLRAMFSKVFECAPHQ